jgi:hypothetical protein
VIFLGRGAYFRQQAWRDKGIGCGLGFHESKVALPAE